MNAYFKYRESSHSVIDVSVSLHLQFNLALIPKKWLCNFWIFWNTSHSFPEALETQVLHNLHKPLFIFKFSFCFSPKVCPSLKPLYFFKSSTYWVSFISTIFLSSFLPWIVLITQSLSFKCMVAKFLLLTIKFCPVTGCESRYKTVPTACHPASCMPLEPKAKTYFSLYISYIPELVQYALSMGPPSNYLSITTYSLFFISIKVVSFLFWFKLHITATKKMLFFPSSLK